MIKLEDAVEVIHEVTRETERLGLALKASAATPATCGDAIEVPEIVLVAVLEVYHADKMFEPGAKTSRHEP